MPIDQITLAHAIDLLSRGGLIAFPTETFYGVAADALNPHAVERLLRVKGREDTKAVACIIGQLEQRALLCDRWPEAAERLANRFWPGPLTLVVPARADLPGPLHPDGFVGMRLSSHDVARQLALGLGRPITATSANLAGEPPVSRAEDIAPALRRGLDLSIDGPPTPGGLGSTVVKIEGDRLTCLRAGAVPYSLCTESW
jgi:L-threonylcarbamoyladenylate synthase